MQKYRLDPNATITVNGKVLQRIIANHAFYTSAGHVAADDTGGYIETNGVNLAHDDFYRLPAVSGEPNYNANALLNGTTDRTSWINAGAVYDNAKVTGGAYINGSGVRIHGDAIIDGKTTISGTVEIMDTAKISGATTISGTAKIFENASVSGTATVSGSTRLFGNTKVYGAASLTDAVTAFGDSEIFGSVTCSGAVDAGVGNVPPAVLASTAVICQRGQVSGSTVLTGNQIINGNTRLVA